MRDRKLHRQETNCADFAGQRTGHHYISAQHYKQTVTDAGEKALRKSVLTEKHKQSNRLSEKGLTEEDTNDRDEISSESEESINHINEIKIIEQKTNTTRQR